nr:hypothetical protein [uncultured Parasutterella sp.]
MSENRAKMSVTQLTLLTAINMMGSGIVMLPLKSEPFPFCPG